MNSNHLTPYPALSCAIQQLDLGGKSILITGGGYGIGKDIARSFAECLPARIVLIGRSETRPEETAADLAVRFPTVTFSYRCVDITSSTDVQALFDWVQTPLDVLINNAGYLPLLQSFMDADLDELQRGLITNVYGTALMIPPSQGDLQGTLGATCRYHHDEYGRRGVTPSSTSNGIRVYQGGTCSLVGTRSGRCTR
ncbi:hypothetical protein Hte_009117 [Hypoxylon texense]